MCHFLAQLLTLALLLSSHSLLITNGVSITSFSSGCIAQVPSAIPTSELNNPDRLDLRKSLIFAVDPPNCSDIDDCMSLEPVPGSSTNYTLGVHIADVDYFVPRDSPLDKHASRSCTTFYLVGRRYDMLPEGISADLASLHQNEDRLAVSVFFDCVKMKNEWTVDKKCARFKRSIIRNKAAMTYAQADNILNDNGHGAQDLVGDPHRKVAGKQVDKSILVEIKSALLGLTEIQRHLRKSRYSNGAVDLQTPEGDSTGSELKFSLDPKTGAPVAIELKKSLEIHSTIAEIMVSVVWRGVGKRSEAKRSEFQINKNVNTTHTGARERVCRRVYPLEVPQRATSYS